MAEAMSDERLADIGKALVVAGGPTISHELYDEVQRLRALDDENVGSERRPLTKRELRDIGMAVVGPLKYVPERWDHETVVKLYWALIQQKGEAMQARRELAELRERIGEGSVEYGLQYGVMEPMVLRAQDEVAYYKQQRHAGLRVRDVYATQWRPAPEAGCRSCGTIERVLGDPPLCTNCANYGAGLRGVVGEWKAAEQQAEDGGGS